MTISTETTLEEMTSHSDSESSTSIEPKFLSPNLPNVAREINERAEVQRAGWVRYDGDNYQCLPLEYIRIDSGSYSNGTRIVAANTGSLKDLDIIAPFPVGSLNEALMMCGSVGDMIPYDDVVSRGTIYSLAQRQPASNLSEEEYRSKSRITNSTAFAEWENQLVYYLSVLREKIAHGSEIGWATAQLPLLTERIAEASTDFVWQVNKRRQIRLDIENALRAGSDEVFEYGMDSELSLALDTLIKRYSNEAVAELDRILDQDRTRLEVLEETLLQIGSIEHNPTHQSRLMLITKHLLKSPAVSVRDYAALGVAEMDDPEAIPFLRLAIRFENSERLRRDLELVLNQLVATQSCRSICDQ